MVSTFVQPLAVVGRPPPGTITFDTLLPCNVCRSLVRIAQQGKNDLGRQANLKESLESKELAT